MYFAKYRYEIFKWSRFLHTMSEKNAQLYAVRTKSTWNNTVRTKWLAP